MSILYIKSKKLALSLALCFVSVLTLSTPVLSQAGEVETGSIAASKAADQKAALAKKARDRQKAAEEKASSEGKKAPEAPKTEEKVETN